MLLSKIDALSHFSDEDIITLYQELEFKLWNTELSEVDSIIYMELSRELNKRGIKHG